MCSKNLPSQEIRAQLTQTEDQEKKQLLAMEEKLKWLEDQHKQGRIPQSIYEAQVQVLLNFR